MNVCTDYLASAATVRCHNATAMVPLCNESACWWQAEWHGSLRQSMQTYMMSCMIIHAGSRQVVFQSLHNALWPAALTAGPHLPLENL